MKRTFISASNIRTLFYGLASIAVLSLTACGKDDDTIENTGTTTTTIVNTGTTTADGIAVTAPNLTSTGVSGRQETGANDEDNIANSTFASQVTIVYSGNSVTVDNSAVSGVTYTKDGAKLVITSTVAGVNYVVSGSTTSGSLKIYSGSKFQLTLNGVDITSTDGPAINIQSGKRAFVVLPAGKTNKLTDSTTYTAQYDSSGNEEDIKGAFFSEGELLFSGTGSLSVNANKKHGIASDDYVRITEGNITVVNSTSATGHAIRTNDAVYIDGGTINLTTKYTDGGDGIQCEGGHIIINGGDITINATDDGITAQFDDDGSGEPYLNINGGTLNITAKGEGIESKLILTINDGTININAVDDAINAGSGLYFNGGKTYAYSSGNDAIDTNGKLGITGGLVVAVGAASAPETSVDATAEDSSYEQGFTITGGYLVAIGRGNTPDTPLSSSTQKTVMLGGLSGAAQIINITSDSGTEIVTFKAPMAYSHILFSNSEITNGTYKIYTGGSVANGEEFNGVYTSGTYSGGTSSSQFTVSGQVTSSGGNNRGGGRGR